MFEKRNIPCLNSNYYRGKYNKKVNKDKGRKCNDCEYKQIENFILNQLKGYNLENCCDLEDSSKKNPDMLFVNAKKISDKIAIEVKRLNNINANDEKYSSMVTAKKKNLENLKISVYKNLISIIKNCGLPQIEMLINSIDIWLGNNREGYIYSPIYNKVGLYYRGNRVKKRDILIKKISIEILRFIRANSERASNGENLIKDYSFNFDDIKFNISFNNLSGFNLRYIERNEIISGMDLPKEFIEKKVMCFYNECKEKFINYLACKKILIIRNETCFDKNKLMSIINKVNKPKIIDEIWIEFIEYYEIYNEITHQLDEITKGKRYIKL
ncbi:hypothetical protein ACSXC4_14970 (plasmid) [Clostridium perfringens]|uniref:hypothetical protein n=1 Tax=Clostridium perfringens TaxID=1502 RepID=UPI00096ABD0A|nr:hypothetical protein [Clostridium perfringens]NGU65298.1 hypothetical protein [Clostridium perfringens]